MRPWNIGEWCAFLRMIACVRSFVRVSQHGSCCRRSSLVRNENGCGGSSPGWRSSREQSIESRCRRGGVPV